MTRELPPDWDSRRKEVYQRDGYECQNCGRKGGKKGHAVLNAHHIVPRHSGGTHKKSNLRSFCEECHKAIHNEDYVAPTHGKGEMPSEWEYMQEKAKEKIADTPCPNCFNATIDDDTLTDFDVHDTHDFLEYNSWPIEFTTPRHMARCSNCNSLYRIMDNDEGEMELSEQSLWNEGASRFWSYGVGVGVICSLVTVAMGTWYYVVPWLLVPISIYYDMGYLRQEYGAVLTAKYWFWAATVPIVNIIVGLIYIVNRNYRSTIKTNANESSLKKEKIHNPTGKQEPTNETNNSIIKLLKFNRCPVCNQKSVKRTQFLPSQEFTCTNCEARFKQNWRSLGFVVRYKLVDGDSDLEGDTRKITDWQRIAISESD